MKHQSTLVLIWTIAITFLVCGCGEDPPAAPPVAFDKNGVELRRPEPGHLNRMIVVGPIAGARRFGYVMVVQATNRVQVGYVVSEPGPVPVTSMKAAPQVDSRTLEKVNVADLTGADKAAAEQVRDHPG